MFGSPILRGGSEYIAHQLRKLGYTVSEIDEKVLHIRWGQEPKEQVKEPEQKELPSLANLKKAADTIRLKSGSK